jgi:hypothetical protein
LTALLWVAWQKHWPSFADRMIQPRWHSILPDTQSPFAEGDPLPVKAETITGTSDLEGRGGLPDTQSLIAGPRPPPRQSGMGLQYPGRGSGSIRTMVHTCPRSVSSTGRRHHDAESAGPDAIVQRRLHHVHLAVGRDLDMGPMHPHVGLVGLERC